jgi:soluble lytic murein transglycosylase-like protein
MRSVVVAFVLVAVGALAWPASSDAAVKRVVADPGVAALQVALRAQGHYNAPIDGVAGPLTTDGLRRLRAQHGIRERAIGRRTRAALGGLGRPLLGQRELGVGFRGWDVSSLEFRLRKLGFGPGRLDGVFDSKTAKALAAFQRRNGLVPDGIAGPRTYRRLAELAGGTARASARPPRVIHRVRPGESFYSIAEVYRVSPLLLARENNLLLSAVIVPGQRLRVPTHVRLGAAVAAPSQEPASRDAVRASLDRWSAVYGVDPKLARAVAWMESGFQEDVVSKAGAIGVMQLLPETWDWLDALIGVKTPRTYDGNVRAGARYLRWLLDDFDGNVRLALAAYYQGARAVRERGLFDDTKQYVTVILRLYGSV